MPDPLVSAQRTERLKAWLGFAGAFAWPLAVLALFLFFAPEIESLFDRMKSGEIGGAKFTFNAAATGFISARIDSLANENDPDTRARLAEDIKNVARTLGDIPPLALGHLIVAADGNHTWMQSTYTEKKEYFDALERAGLAVVRTVPETHGDLRVRLLITGKGRDLLKSLGMTDTDFSASTEK